MRLIQAGFGARCSAAYESSFFAAVISLNQQNPCFFLRHNKSLHIINGTAVGHCHVGPTETASPSVTAGR